MTMSQQQPDSETHAEAIHSPGQYMRGCREAAGLSIEDVAADLRILPNFVRFIEQDANEKLPGETFVRGYYRAYAKLMNLDEDDVTQRYNRFISKRTTPVETKNYSNRSIEAPSQDPILTSKEAKKQSNNQTGQQKTIWVVVGVLLFGLVLVALNNQAPPLQEELSPPIVTGLPLDEIEDGSSTDSEGTEAVEIDSSVEKPSVGDSSSNEPLSKKLLLTFSEDSWVEVTDSKGDVLLTDLLQAGATTELDGEPPYNVFLGNGLGVQLVYQGQLVEFTPDLEKNTARVFVGNE